MSPRSRTVLRLLASLALLTLVAVPIAGGAGGERIDTAAGSGVGGFGGDGGLASAALLTSPSDVAALGGGAYLIADSSNHRIRRVDAEGIVTTVAGAGPAAGATGGFAGDGLAATNPLVRLNLPRGVSPLLAGGFLIADTGNNRIRKVAANGVITTVAGSGAAGYNGDNIPATQALLNQPGGVAALPDGSFLIADTGNSRIRLVSPGGAITTVAGNTKVGFAGDGGAATSAALNLPARVVPLTGGGFLIADTGNSRIRRVDTTGAIATVAGSSAIGAFAGDGGPATRARLNQPEGVAVRPDGSLAIADSTNDRVRDVGIDGTISTLAGTGTGGLSGDGGDPAAAQLSHPRAVAYDAPRLWVADAFNHRVRVVAAPTAAPPEDLNPVPPPGVSPPVLGRSVVAKPRIGPVLVRLPGTTHFVDLTTISNLPMGSELDVGDGSVVLFFRTTRGGKRAKAIVTGGRFLVLQPDVYDTGQRPGELRLSGPLYGCAPPVARTERTDAAGAAAAAPRVHAAGRAAHGRRLKVRARGRIKTRGKYGAAVVRGTRWTTVDRCPEHPRPGTLVVVSKGVVAVRSFVLQRTFLVPAGNRVLAPAHRP